MPQSKRAKEVFLTQTSKKTKDHKSSIIQDIRTAVDDHETIYLFSFENMRSNKFKKIRMDFREPESNGRATKIFLGKNKLMQVALGRTPEEEYGDNLREISKRITGSVGLIFTNKPTDEVESYFAKLHEEDFARAGNISHQKIVVTEEMLENHPVSMVELFRKLGLPVDIQNGKLVHSGNKKQHILCKEGDTLTAEQCKLLTHFGIKLAEFKVDLLCRWNSSDGEFVEF